ncbi:cytidyltransferase-related protein [Desulfosarcina variabilis str. Montpellier]|uniref:AAA family ATPase n=1 Tax=Desulfosarcina variabilis TaxID=2300 RepID=UPI003AFA9F9F
MRKTGLTLGKYAPFHKGHQHVIETALAEMDAVVVIVYNASDVTDVPLATRAGWIRSIYPGVRVIEAPDGPQVVGDTPAIRALHEDYLLSRLKISGITHFYSSEFYGGHISRALGAVDRQVDPQRRTVPVSGTLIRESPYQYRHFLDPLVYRDLIKNIVFLGAPCTGKTTLAEALAQCYDTVWMPEYGREYWEKHQHKRRLSQAQLLTLARTHLDLENRKLLEANCFLFTDTNVLATVMFARYYHGSADEPLEALARQAAHRYHTVFLCDTDIAYEDTWDR